MVKLDIKVPKRRVHLETNVVERGKPREQETQNLVGELLQKNLNGVRDRYSVDKCLPPRNRYRTWLIRF